MIVDSHVHVFPPAVIARRQELLTSEPTFAAIYGDPRARMATADEVLASMADAGVDVSVVVNYAWHDESLVDQTNTYILEAAAQSDGRLLPFVSVHLTGHRAGHAEGDDAVGQLQRNDARVKVRHLSSRGARGIGELRPANLGYSLANSDEADALGWAAAAFDLPVLVHASEPVGHAYGGKEGLPIAELEAFVRSAAGVTVIAAHWGGGLPFFALMPEVRDAIAGMYVDTAASHLLYEPRVYRTVVDLIGADRVLWASDFPLITQRQALQRLQEAGLHDDERAKIAGENAAALFGL